MRSLAPDNRGRRPHNENARRDDSSKSLYDHANSFFLSVGGLVDNGNFLSPEKVENHRGRQALAQFIEIVAPNDGGQLSSELLDEFGSIGRMLGQSEAALHRVLPSNPVLVKLLTTTEKLIVARLKNELPRKIFSATDQRLVRYLQARIGARTSEAMRVLFLDGANHLLGDEEFGAGSPQRIFVQPRSILKRALELDASGLILAHNHPGGDVRPSKRDIEFTKSIKTLCVELEIRLHDHIIIASDNWTSFRKLKII
ncbi:MAG: RadC family protein [Sphingorhabdus sp.]